MGRLESLESLVPAEDHKILLDVALTNAIAEWKKDLEKLFSDTEGRDTFFTVAWEAAVWKRRNDGLFGQDRHITFAIVHLKATPESYMRLFLRPNDTLSSPSRYSALQSPLSIGPNLNIIRLNLSEEKQYALLGIRPAAPELLQIQPTSSNKPFGSLTKIRNDLDCMWRYRIHSDIQLAVPSTGEEEIQENMVSIFSCHRSLLVARSPYFRELLGVLTQNPVAWKDGLSVVPLPSTLFTPNTLEVVLRFLYTGILEFPQSGFSVVDLSIPFAVHRGAMFLRISSLMDVTVAHIMSILHGLFHAHLNEGDYFRWIGGIWENMVAFGGCLCCQCGLSVPRLLRFFLEPTVRDTILERGARRALVGLFGAGWCTQEFASLPGDILDSLLLDLQKMIIPRNALSLLFAAEKALARLDDLPQTWNQPIERLLLSARALIEQLICKQSRPCLNCEEWKTIITTPAGKHNTKVNSYPSHETRLKWILGAISRSVAPQEANAIHDTLSWFTDALIFPETQNELFSDLMMSIKNELIQKSKETQRPQSLSSISSSVLEVIDPTSSMSDASQPYSNPSSNTDSTDYGLYYRRMAISQETISDTASTIRQRRSWGWRALFNII